MAKNNLKDKTKIVLNDSKAILAKATSIRKEYDKLFEILRIQAKPYGLIETRTNDKPMLDINRDTQNEYLQKAILHSERSYVFDLDPDAKETPKNRKYVQKAIYPDATVSSLKIILLNFLKKDERVVLYFIHELYRFDIILTANLIMDVQQEKRELLMDAFKFLIKNDQTSDRYIEKLLAASIIRDVNFFTELVDKCDYIDAKKVNSLFSNTKWNDETFLLLLYANTIRKTVSKSEVFYTLAYKAFISCNCSNFQISDGTLSEFMQSALKEKDYKIISKMITVLGIEYIDNHYSNGFLNELKMDIFADKVPFVLQFEYIKMLARSDEYISNMNDLYSLFEKIQSERKAFFTDYLYIAEVAKENQNISIFRDHLEPLNVKFVSKYDDYEIMYKKAISILWEKPYKLKEFLETTEMCNPYVIKTKSAYYTANRELVDSSFYQIRDLFYMDVDIDAILFIYLKTYIHRDVPMEYLFDIAYMHGHIKELIEVTSSYEFSGMVYSINESHHLVIRPVEYYSFGYYENTTPYIWTYEPALYGVSVRNYLTYNIINYRNGHFDFGNIKLENLSDDAEQKWYELLSVIKVILTSGIMNDIDKQLLNHYSDFSPGLFFKRIELDDLLQLFHAFVDRSELFLPIINELCWNRSICCCEQLPTIFFGEMKKYREKAYELFVQMQLLHMSDEFGIELYIKTFFKTIIPLPNMLLLYQVEKAIPIWGCGRIPGPPVTVAHWNPLYCNPQFPSIL